jgi:uncharacterized RDD family membrane protein YckC
MQASFSSRFAAFKLDVLFFMVIWEVLRSGLEQAAPELMNFEMICVMYFVVSVIYFFYPTYKTGQTLGKKIIGIKVVPVRDEDEPLQLWQALVRELPGKLISSLPLFLGYFWAFRNPERKTWHDNMSKTWVISLSWQEEPSILQKLQHIVISLATIPLGVAFILFLILYTSMPLDSVKERMEAAGIQVGALSGSLAGGLRMSEFGRHDSDQDFVLRKVEVKFSLWSLLNDGTVLLEKVSAQQGVVQVPEHFSWWVLGSNLVILNQVPDRDVPQSVAFKKFKIGKFEVKNLSLKHLNTDISKLEELSVKNFEKGAEGFHVEEVIFNLKGFKSKFTDVGSAPGGQVNVAGVTGGVTSEMMPMLKGPVDFHLKGTIRKQLADSQFEGAMVVDKIKFSYGQKKLSATVDKLILNELFKTKVPLENLDLKWSTEGASLMEIMMKQESSYGVTLCGAEFPLSAEVPALERPVAKFQFRMTPKPILSLENTLTRADGSLEDLFEYHLQGSRQGSRFASDTEMISDLCYQKKAAELAPDQTEVVNNFAEALHPKPAAVPAVLMATAAPAPEPAAPPVAKAAPVLKNKLEINPGSSLTVKPLPSATQPPKVTAAQVRDVVAKGRAMLRAGTYGEGIILMGDLKTLPADLPPQEVGAFYNLKAWLYFYSNQTAEAIQNFDTAFKARQDVSDAEGLLRVNEILNKQDEMAKWFAFIKVAIQTRPDLKNRLSPNLQRKISSDEAAPAPSDPAPEESHP